MKTVTFDTRTFRDAARFTILKHVREQFGLSSRSGAVLHLVIRTPVGRILFEGIKTTKSGPEIYGKDIRASGIKAGRQRIRVTASIPDPLE